METDNLSDLTAACIRCGFCLEACPTFQITGEETESPRGRIYLIRSADSNTLGWAEIAPHVDRCLGCRACETACPSGVHYGQIFELAKAKMPSKRWRSSLLRQLTDVKRARRQFKLAALLPGRKLPNFVSRLLTKQPTSTRIPRPQESRNYPPLEALPPIKGQVALLRGCVMDALFPNVHEATIRLLRRVGFEVIEIRNQCCGALHAHSGDLQEARKKFNQLVTSLPSDIILLTNSAGCGSHLKESGAMAKDVSEFLYENGLVDALKMSHGITCRVGYHDACHLAHGQGVRRQPRELLRSVPGAELVEIPDSDRCCGSAGIYNVQQPTLAKHLLDQKWGSIEVAKPDIVVSGNPGCHAWIDQARAERSSPIQVLHTMEFLEASFSGLFN